MEKMAKRVSKPRNNTLAKQEEDHCSAGISTRSSLRLKMKFESRGGALGGSSGGVLHIQNASNEILRVSTPDGQSSEPQRAAGNVRSVLNRKITRCVNSVMSGKKESTTEGSHVPVLNRSDPVALLGNRNEKRKQIAGKRTRNDQPSPLGSLVDSMEEEPTTLVPKGSNLLSKNSSSLELQTQPQVVQDGGSMTPNAHCSPFLHPTGNEKSRSLLEKFLKMRSILENDRNTLELLTPILHDAQDADLEVRVKPEPICIDLEDETVYIVGKDYEFTLRKIMSAHGDIAKDCFYSLDIRTNLVETVCKIYKKLEASNIFEIDISEMSRILQTLDQLHHAKLDVKWLIDRVSQRIELSEELPRILTFRNIANRKSGKIEDRAAMLERYKSQLEFHEDRSKSLKERIKEEGEELASEKRVTEVFNIFSETWVKKVKSVGQPLAHGLL